MRPKSRLSSREILAKNIETLANERGLSVFKLADLLDIPRTTLHHILLMKRNASIDYLDRIAEPLKMSPATLLTPGLGRRGKNRK